MRNHLVQRHARPILIPLFLALLGGLLLPADSSGQTPAPRSVTINRHPLPADTLRLLEQHFQATIPDGRYWYDAVSGAWSLEGGHTRGFTLAGLPLGGKVPADISGGGTGVFINGRELHPLDVQALQALVGQVLPGRYWLDGQGYAGYEGGPAIANLQQVAQQLYRQGGGVGENYGGGAGAYANPRTGIGIITDGQGGGAVFGQYPHSGRGTNAANHRLDLRPGPPLQGRRVRENRSVRRGRWWVVADLPHHHHLCEDRMPSPLRHTHLALFALLAAACGTDRSPSDPLIESAVGSLRAPGFVATASNATAENAVLVFARAADGTLGSPQRYSTGGAGTSGGLGNQGGLVVSPDRRFLLAVNAGSHDITVFRIEGGELRRVGVTPSGGLQPVSLAVRGSLVYVLNAGGAGGVRGFRMGASGDLTPITGSARPLSSGASGPAQVGLSPDGRWLVVTEKATNVIGLYRVAADGTLGDYVAALSAGATPFGFSFGRQGGLFVSEAFGGALDASALSSYGLGRGLSLQPWSASVGTTETAACWVEITPDGRFAYVTNTGSATVSGYGIGTDGTVALLDSDGVTGVTGAGPIDLTITPDGRRLYTLDSGGHAVSGFSVRSNGSLERIPAVAPAVPAGANGLVSW